ncbi:hypothetical protein RM780_19060 [Streptomyces sp. DSM 44917]|uniref:Uncharacterized protein n=2 Tax=Streptomyces boetiae TaxID=3075541 RepID=A0ABU2LBW4_9ACTN|nr:hypothetical protein [Streptomyces sp. DSM 44917]MDT0309044.1 hypothetical protein [Streptomyces sp. DSM 44917]
MAAALTAGMTAGLAALGSGVASADEHYYGDPKIGPRVGLVNTGQIDDPLEDVLEHASFLFGSETVQYD